VGRTRPIRRRFCRFHPILKTWVTSEEFSRLMRNRGIVSGNKFDRFFVQASIINRLLRCNGEKNSITGNVISPQKTIRNDPNAERSTNSKSPVVPWSKPQTYCYSVDALCCRRWLFENWYSVLPSQRVNVSRTFPPTASISRNWLRYLRTSKQDGTHNPVRYMLPTVGQCRV
jgi:hypothetical protein